MRRVLFFIAAVILCLSGCTQTGYPDLPENAVRFHMGTYIDHSDDDASYATIEFEGRTYMPYGTVKKSVRGSDVDRCIGFFVQDGVDDTDRRVYTLAADPDHNFLMDRYSGKTIMEQPSFWRAVDTRGKDIPVPEYIDSLGYAFWE